MTSWIARLLCARANALAMECAIRKPENVHVTQSGPVTTVELRSVCTTARGMDGDFSHDSFGFFFFGGVKSKPENQLFIQLQHAN